MINLNNSIHIKSVDRFEADALQYQVLDRVSRAGNHVGAYLNTLIMVNTDMIIRDVSLNFPSYFKDYAKHGGAYLNLLVNKY